MKVAVVRFPGSNCDEDALRAAAAAGAEAGMVWHREADLGGADVVILPGGFSYGDYLRAGAIARFSPVMRAVAEHAQRGGPVLGICNGFQILCEAALLPGALVRNRDLKFVCRQVSVRVENTDTPFTLHYRPGQELRLPIAHGEGRFVADEPTLAALEAEGRVVFRYAGENPNGSMNGIAGVVNEAGNVVGLMPHPERAADALLGSADGAALFASVASGAEVEGRLR